MRFSRFWSGLVFGAISLILLAIAIFGIDNPYYYRTIAYALSFASFFSFIYLIRTSKPAERTIRTFSYRTSVILVALGSFFIGAVSGIMFYDSYWGVNDFLARPSISLNINSLYGALFFISFGVVGVIFLAVGLKNILRRRP